MMEPVAGLVLLWPGTSETAGASSSSSSVAIPEPMAVEPDLMVLEVSKGPRIAILKSLKSVR